jgi:prophage regulatory protein
MNVQVKYSESVMATEVPSFPTRKKLLRLKQVVETTGLSRASIYRQIQSQTFPRPVKIAARSVAWVEDEVQHWIEHLARNGEKAS